MEDDAVSVIEEDHIDSMFSRGKRTTTGSSRLQKKRKRGQQPIFSGQPGQRKHQQRITSSLGRAMSISSTRTRSLQTSKDGRRAKRPKGESGGKRERMKSRPPQLSILDVVEPSAPAFIRIAARTASRRPDRGRSSPSRKAIMLGTRQDTIDAVEVLKRWNDGMIQPRDVVPPLNRLQLRRNEKAEATQARPVHNLGPPQNQVTGQKAATRFYQPRRLVKQVSMDNFVEVGTRNQPSPNVSVDSLCRVEIPRPHSSSYRPAQLEMAGDTANRSIFDARKRVLDALYRQSRKSSPTPRNLRLEQLISSQVPVLHQQPVPQILNSLEQNNIPEPLENRRRARFRKQVRPQSVDVSAPQYTHANDPLPRELSPPTVAVDLQKSEEVGKLLRLAPYGTHYTQHFEVFPLDRGVFFHESTIVGSGRLKRALDSLSLGNLDNPRGRCILTIDEHVLHWGPWDAQVSSELGILSDWVMERLDTSSINTELETTTPLRAVNFILIYLQDYLSFNEPESSTIFAGRLVDILQTFERRLKEIFDNSRYIPQSFIEVVTRILVIAVQILRLCQKLNKHPESFQVEEILKRLGTTTARLLLQTNLKEVHDIYGRLQQMPFREEGIRENEYALICWVTLIRTFEEARLPRAGFWEVVSPAILGPDIERTFDATVLERAWRTLFTLLPLGEFDTTGVTVSRLRHTTPLEGWTIPQRLLQRVFQLYGSNSRQSPSFNDYLRAVVGRCHYLVEQWGWYKCNAILGTVFDFFAAQDLRNLRNEEVYQSPQFLEELSGSPLLATSPEDRCFHIFLKLIAMSIQRLKKINLMKEIRNLVARLQPNHSRQYDKVMATYEADIAALRNHHDLLCTLFWAAPADLRPSLQSIEGLVVLGSSHKEACLINLRAWNRLSRFIVSTCGDISEYKTLADWQRNISQQVLEQFLSVETEVNQQLLGMSAEACKNITQQHKNAVISQNKKVAMDLLYSSMKSFLEVIHHTQTLGAVSFALNAYPLEQILTRLSFSSGSSDWSILKAALDILDYFLVRIDGFTSAEPMHLGQSWHEEDAIMLLERKFALPLITVVRDTVNLNSQYLSIGQVDNHKLCVEQAVALVGRIGACLIHARLVRLRQFFQAGGYNLFQDMLKPTTSTARKYVALFLATIVDRGVVDFKDLGVTPLNLFLAEITKPFEFLAYESRLAMSFKQLGETYLGNSVIDIGKTPNYSSNGDLFNCILIMMRKTLHQADPSQKLQLQNTFSKALRSVMDRMKADLKLMALNSAGHMNYVEFVRLIIGTIRSQDLCPVDSFFYQISQEYSPSRQDPRLQTAAILSWGLKLEEGDTKAISGLFYLLFPSFKIALANGELGNEANILTESMKHVHVFSFMLSTMLPAIIKATTQVSGSWILIETYVEAIDAWLSSACVHRQIGGDTMADVLALYTMVLEGAGSLQTRASLEFRNEDIVTLTAMIKIANLLSSSVTAYLINEPESPLASDFAEVTNELTGFARAANASLSDLTKSFGEQNEMILEPVNLFKGLRVSGSRGAFQPNEQINRFSSHIVQDIRNNWVSNGACITIKGPSRGQRPSSTQSGQGTSPPQWERRKLLQNLREQVRTWNHAHGTTMTKEIHERFIDELLF
ncbi:putative protein mms22 [Rosellinia necatrix]|uniref:Mus7 mms22 family protein n=1 Tax=Rosellinia necatrix TaxID=77044 RepID=A0A1S8AB79_ROSNE|nr:putative protein mms22 [Rosellinia necatrix]